MRRKATTLALAVAAILFAVSTSLAHAKLVSSTPSAGETSTMSPSSVSLEFSVRVQSRMSSVVVKDRSGTSIMVGAIGVRFEVLLAMIVLLLAAILAFLPPAREHKPISASEAPAVQEAI